MKIFISWSGTLSQRIAEAIKDWLPGVLQSVKPYFTPSDIEKGTRWNADIAKELEQSKIGVFVFTKDNLNSQWMIFEAGAISKTLDNSKVCPILFGVDNSDFKGPLTQFQTSQFNKVDFKKLIRTINNSLVENKLDEKILDDVFEMWWPKIDGTISKILESNKVQNASIRNDRELLEEILALTRLTSKNMATAKVNAIRKYDEKKLEKLTGSFIGATIGIFDLDWDHTKSCLGINNNNHFVSNRGNFLSPGVQDEGNNWSNRGSYLEAFRRLKNFMEDNEIPYYEQLEVDDLPF